jgi:sodium transport system ATP-binding protein
MIEVAGLRKRFGNFIAVDGIDVTAADGRVTGLIGPNGAGKTTTFRAIYGVLRADDGSVKIDGFDNRAAPLDALARLGILPDVRGLYPRLTGREHLRFFAGLQDMEPSRIEPRIDVLVRRLGMSDFVDRRARGYSRGQELKVALARALIHEPRNIVLDEPSNGLDVESARAVRDLVRELRAAGHCILISSHVMTEIAALCDHLYVIERGRIVAEGLPVRLMEEFAATTIEDLFMAVIERNRQMRGVGVDT